MPDPTYPIPDDFRSRYRAMRAHGPEPLSEQERAIEAKAQELDAQCELLAADREQLNQEAERLARAMMARLRQRVDEDKRIVDEYAVSLAEWQRSLRRREALQWALGLGALLVGIVVGALVMGLWITKG